MHANGELMATPFAARPSGSHGAPTDFEYLRLTPAGIGAADQ
jgi:hypothetical protein